jgi:hypothetical protein
MFSKRGSNFWIPIKKGIWIAFAVVWILNSILNSTFRFRLVLAPNYLLMTWIRIFVTLGVKKWDLSDLWEIQAKGWVRSSLWALEHLSFVKQSSWYLLLLEVKPPRWLGVALELPRLWWAVRKFVKARFTFERKEARASEVRKAVERDPVWSWHLVGNSSYLNGGVGIMGGDSELW